MQWSEDLLTHIEEIDRQHKTLFDCLARLESAHNEKERWSILHYAIIELKNFVQVHFSVEEALLRLFDYPLLSAHIDEHRGFAQSLADIEKKTLEQHDDVSDEMIALLRRWLVEHIGKSDHQYVPYLKSSSIRFTDD